MHILSVIFTRLITDVKVLQSPTSYVSFVLTAQVRITKHNRIRHCMPFSLPPGIYECDCLVGGLLIYTSLYRVSICRAGYTYNHDVHFQNNFMHDLELVRSIAHLSYDLA